VSFASPPIWCIWRAVNEDINRSLRSPVSRWGPRGTAGALFAGQLTFEGVGYDVDGHAIVSDLSFELKPGEIACLLGPSGCGKTTLLRLAAGIQRASAGRIAIDGSEVDGPKTFVPPERRNLGMVFQDFALFPHLTVIENVAFGLRALSRAEAIKVSERALERVGLASFRNTYSASLSGGEQQRVALARAVVTRPQVMLMDEPFSGLDQRLREAMRAETLALLRETRATCVLVTHDPVEAMEMADRIFVMRKGRLVQMGAPADVFEKPNDLEVARFFSDVNELAATCEGGLAITPLGRFPAEGGHVTVVIRPQAMRLARDHDGIEGLVLENRFLGDKSRLMIQFNGLEEPFCAMIAGRGPDRGRIAHFRVDATQVLVFKKPAPGSS
jgi:iron(III) transport system ATP-binding protein